MLILCRLRCQRLYCFISEVIFLGVQCKYPRRFARQRPPNCCSRILSALAYYSGEGLKPSPHAKTAGLTTCWLKGIANWSHVMLNFTTWAIAMHRVTRYRFYDKGWTVRLSTVVAALINTNKSTFIQTAVANEVRRPWGVSAVPRCFGDVYQSV